MYAQVFTLHTLTLSVPFFNSHIFYIIYPSQLSVTSSALFPNIVLSISSMNQPSRDSIQSFKSCILILQLKLCKRLFVPFYDKIDFTVEGCQSHVQPPKLRYRPLSAVCKYLFQYIHSYFPYMMYGGHLCNVQPRNALCHHDIEIYVTVFLNTFLFYQKIFCCYFLIHFILFLLYILEFESILVCAKKFKFVIFI